MSVALLALLAGCSLSDGKDGPGDGDGDTASDVPACEGVGFLPTSSEWALPQGFPDATFDAVADTDTRDPYVWGLVDLDGDGSADLVFARNDSVPAVGTDAWHVYGNDGDGFGSTPASWSLPQGFPEGTFDALGDDDAGDGLAWALADLHGDDRADLVLTANPDVSGVGTSTWQVYENDGAGFGAAPVSWSLPQGFPAATFDALADTDSSDAYAWALADVDGDGLTDLVVTANANASDVGTTTWQVYANTGEGFASTPASWSLPQGFPAATFDRLADDDAGDDVTWGLADLDGDGATDLVLTRSSAMPDLGTTTWKVHRNEADGFANVADSWSLPTGFPAGTFDALADADWSDGYHWALSDLGGDGAPDLVFSWNESVGGVGTTSWQVYGNEASGFASVPTSWALPQGYPTDTFDYLGDDATDGVTWGLASMDGDVVTDLIFAANANVPELGTTSWQVYRGDCR